MVAAVAFYDSDLHNDILLWIAYNVCVERIHPTTEVMGFLLQLPEKVNNDDENSYTI